MIKFVSSEKLVWQKKNEKNFSKYVVEGFFSFLKKNNMSIKNHQFRSQLSLSQVFFKESFYI